MSIRFSKTAFALFTIIISLTIGGCSTKKNTSVSRAFHNLTSKYNYYFNAKESYSNAMKRVEKDFDYNYTFPLPVMLAGDKQVASMVGGDMDRAITKCTDMISRHSITVKPERKGGAVSSREKKFYSQNEYVRWVREGWLLIGKARVWKGSYDEARMTFEHILVQFPETPMWYESSIWLARIDIITGDFVSAEDRLSSLRANRKYPKNKHFTHLLESTSAAFYQKQENIPQTQKHLERALENAPDRTHKLRYTYLLAQYSQRQQNLVQSNKLFRSVTRMSPSYEMSFNAKVNMAQNFQGGSGGQEMIRSLLKMAKDEKNREFLDQIYFALGNIERSNGNMDKAIEYYKISASKSVRNNHQKGLSYLVLADYYFAKPNYTVSQAYYDSSYNALDADFPGYTELEVKTLNLNKLVENLNIVATEDSLQKIASMTPRERDAVIAEQIKKVRENEDRLRLEEQEGRDRFAQFQTNQRTRPQETPGGSWYFYNQSSLSFGLSEFQMRWGRRKLEDNWRRSNKREVLESATITQVATDSSGVPSKVLDNKSREFYLQDLPLTDSLVEISNNRIQEALFRVGEVYQNDLKDYPEAIKAYELLDTRFPQGSYSLSGYYNLYQISRFNQQPADMEKYKQTIISRFPTSTYALMLSNPNYLENMQKEQRVMEEFYQQTYSLFQQGNCSEASRRAREGMERFKNTDLVPKFHFIAAQCVGRSGDIRGYKNALSEVVELYPKTEVAKSAADIIVFINKRELQLAAAKPDVATDKPTDQAKPSAIYRQPNGQHIFLAIVPKKSPLNQLRFNLVSFNVDNYIDLNLNVANRELTEFVELITVEPLKNQKEAMEYYQKAIEEQGLMGNLSSSDYTLTVISRENLEILMKDKSVAEYLNFFRANYLKQ